MSLAWIAGVGASLALAGCVSVPDGPEPMCHTTNDCDRSQGEVCEEGICWGNPPPGPFAAVVSPPSMRQDLTSREIPQVAIPDFGWIGDLALEAPVLLSGKILACAPSTTCDTAPLAGTVTVSRRSQFSGGPGFKAVVDVATGDSFAIPVPRTRADDDPYTITIVPQSSQVSGTHSAAELVPPLRMQLSIMDNTNTQPFALGGSGLPTITGSLTDSLARPIGGYRISALGRWDQAEPPTEVSTIAFTDDQSGGFSVTLSEHLVGPVELVARPTGTLVGPTVRVGSIDSTKSSTRNIIRPSNLGGLVTLQVQVKGLDDSGKLAPVRAAQVSVSGATLPSQLTTFTMSDQNVTDETGSVALHLLNGDAIASSYRLAITPPVSSSLSVVFDQKVPSLVGLSQLALPPIRLGARVVLSGRILDSDDKPLANVVVTARPSLRFLWTLDAAPQAFIASIPAPTTVTGGGGDFVLPVDADVPNVAQSWGSYDLVFEPATSARAPTLVVPEIDTRSLDPIVVGDVHLPEAAFVHGRITGPDGRSVEDAEIKLYRITTQLTLCSEVAHAPASCPIPAKLEARNTSDSEGTVRLILPR